MEMDAVALISQVGFPIFMVLWFMLRMEKVINNNTVVLNEVLKKL